MELDAVADELYALLPEEFVAAREADVRRARADGDRALAALIHELRRPTVAAWLTNQLVRRHAEEMTLLLDLGRRLREVMAEIGGDELREMTRQRYQLVSLLVDRARALGQARGHKVTDDVAQSVRMTLEATLSDENSAHAVAAGRLCDALEVSGFSLGVATDGPRPRGGDERATTGGTVTEIGSQRRRRGLAQAERDVETAERSVGRATAQRERAEADLASAQRDREEAAESVDRLRRTLEEAAADLEVRGRREHLAREASSSAQQTLHRAEEQLVEARARLRELAAD